VNKIDPVKVGQRRLLRTTGQCEQRPGSKERAKKKADEDARREAYGEATQKGGTRDTQRHLNRVGYARSSRDTAMNVKNRSSKITAELDVPAGASGSILSQGGRLTLIRHTQVVSSRSRL
jgi:hypothetical protein